jgi:DNA-binding IclR family transcriptional regulator
MSELLKILLVGQELLGVDRSLTYLVQRAGCSPATMKRYLAELRHLGCQIVSRRESGGWVYRLENADAVQRLLLRWIELERGRTLLS